jgi:hypothetical protein
VAGLEWLVDMKVKHVEAYGDSQLVVQQVCGESQCLKGALHCYRERCGQMVEELDTFHISHVCREENRGANNLTQQASRYEVRRGRFWVKERSAICDMVVVQGDGSVSTKEGHKKENVLEDWRQKITHCIKKSGEGKDHRIRQQLLKYMLLDDELYRRPIDDVLLKCLSEEQAKVAMGEVHEGMCGTHRSAHKMKWVLKRACFYWPTMVEDCIKYFKGCDVCQRFGNIQLAPASMLHPIVKPWPFWDWIS